MREEIVRLRTLGMRPSHIAKKLGVYFGTVKWHIDKDAESYVREIFKIPDPAPSALSKITGRDRTREMVRIRDNHECQSCHKKWIEGTRRFDVHHLNGKCGKMSKKYDGVDTIHTLITLCHKCHFNHPEHSVQNRICLRDKKAL